MDYDYHCEYTGFAIPGTDKSVLKDTTGRYRTNIFYEFNKTHHDDYPPLYTMREEPYNGLPSAYLIFMTSDSEYEAAMKLVGSWQHWQRLLKVKAFREGKDDGCQWVGIESWRAEKELQDKAHAYNQLKTSAAAGNVTAQKIILDGPKAATKRGRPSKEEIKKQAAEQAEHARSLKDDLNRIKLVADNGSTGNS